MAETQARKKAEDSRRARDEEEQKEGNGQGKPQLADDPGATPREDSGDWLHGSDRREARGTTREEDLAAHESMVAQMRADADSEDDLQLSSRSNQAITAAWQRLHHTKGALPEPESAEALEAANIRHEMQRRGLLT